MAPKCPCSWGALCSRYEYILANKGGSKRYRRGAGGRIRVIYNPNSYKNLALRAAIHHHLCVAPNIQAENREYCIARHHFHPGLLDYLLDKKQFRLKKHLTTPLIADVASDFGIEGRLNMYPRQPSNPPPPGWMHVKDNTKFIPVPNYGKLKVKELVEQVQSSRLTPSRKKRNDIAAARYLTATGDSSSVVNSKGDTDASGTESDKGMDAAVSVGIESPLSRALQQSEKELVATVKKQYAEISNRNISSEMVSTLSVLYALPEAKKPIEAPDGNWIVPCPGFITSAISNKCMKASILSRYRLESCCSNCTRQQYYKKKREKSRDANGSKRIDPSSHANWTKLSPSSVAKRAASVKKKNAALNAKLGRLEHRLSDSAAPIDLVIAVAIMICGSKDVMTARHGYEYGKATATATATAGPDGGDYGRPR
eukprot:CAMPEP_0178696158 /NCGR_PEP_ID=MMETSP0699-20121125/9255_1 /TAXON_ID=265572 /ORGANISM="Extubocellulus spinifer, Strain CCMP396" /LENGTH=425 /DNA_ID=CAMNT_0020341935 /DNA_START=340 /DNA_END=1617 /DNA_ORIENTATION=-